MTAKADKMLYYNYIAIGLSPIHIQVVLLTYRS